MLIRSNRTIVSSINSCFSAFSFFNLFSKGFVRASAFFLHYFLIKSKSFLDLFSILPFSCPRYATGLFLGEGGWFYQKLGLVNGKVEWNIRIQNFERFWKNFNGEKSFPRSGFKRAYRPAARLKTEIIPQENGEGGVGFPFLP